MTCIISLSGGSQKFYQEKKGVKIGSAAQTDPKFDIIDFMNIIKRNLVQNE